MIYFSFLTDSYAHTCRRSGPVDLRDQGQINYGGDQQWRERE